MRHRQVTKTLDRKKGSREALVRGLVTNLFAVGSITTTPVRAKVTAQKAAHILTAAKKSAVGKRRSMAYLYSDESREQFEKTWLPKLEQRPSGVTRITKLYPRRGDAAEQVKLELIA